MGWLPWEQASLPWLPMWSVDAVSLVDSERTDGVQRRWVGLSVLTVTTFSLTTSHITYLYAAITADCSSGSVIKLFPGFNTTSWKTWEILKFDN